MKTRKLFVLIAGLTLCLSSCKSKKDFIYLTNVDPGVEYAYKHPDTRVHAGDRLRITVSSKSPELAVPFNSNGGAFLTLANNGSIEASAQTANANYRVDNEGYIDFPLLGKLHVEGLSANEVQDLIKNKIIEGKYINNPLVTMEFQNFRYTMLGATANGIQTADDGHINLIQAIANAGGVAGNGNMKRVLVYREENGKLVMYENDLTDKAVFESPCYQLQQNDIVYVEPKYKKTDAGDKAYKVFSIVLSVIGAFSSFIWAYNSIKN